MNYTSDTQKDELEHASYAWSTADHVDSATTTTSAACTKHLELFFLDPPSLAIATEASSHPTGLVALEWQPWHWAGGGLGNIDECPLQTCIAGAGIRRDSLTFASLCIVPECTALDLVAHDFQTILERLSSAAQDVPVAHEYTTLVQRITVLNKFLGTGWTCGDFIVPWTIWPFGFLFFFFASLSLVGVSIGSLVVHRKRPSIIAASTTLMTTSKESSEEEKEHQHQLTKEKCTVATCCETVSLISNSLDTADKKSDTLLSPSSSLIESEVDPETLLLRQDVDDNSDGEDDNGGGGGDDDDGSSSPSSSSTEQQDNILNVRRKSCSLSRFWICFDAFENIQELWMHKSTETAVLDGLRTGSICWIIAGHTMAITGSVAGFSNPKEVFPPTGYLAGLFGQLILSSKFGVDTFLVISGFLTFYVLNRKLRQQRGSDSFNQSTLVLYIKTLPKLALARAARILPLYVMVLLFYTQIAPHLGGGPFWYQWLALLKPCHDFGWTNLLFINNFVPWEMPTTGTCLYHSWYLAVDMQLFLICSFLVFWHQKNPIHARRATAFLWLLSLSVGTYLAIVRRWSVNTFDGAAVARYDVEAYAKPHIRGQCYLAGMYVAMLLPESTRDGRTAYTWKHRIAEALALLSIFLVTFVTYEGANSRRPCQYQDWPETTDCGSEWSDTVNWIYTTMSRTLWSASIGILMYLFVGRHSGVSPISSVLSWRCWTPLSHLSFAVYLIHPILIFMWELGSTEKDVFQPLTFGMNVVSVCVVSYLVALVAALMVEIPAAQLWKTYISRGSKSPTNGDGSCRHQLLSPNQTRYGSIQQDPEEIKTAKRNI